ncbi:histidinol phosphate phosphatase domain-containing protein [Methanonatronarchaeum sp. AMET6-2]|uniref:histidinol phosphate phosphatase domain-containing protein n=1 Tax=Methanonatronarchaeum sp. AMET6-2 TaxID=2933293 RepID=UPI00121CD796|nr:histidinol phosphate phosphatase domain-containing protein [Methanonatronarchaeum sp. AMET6-2]RZN63485.1 MAG: histidinol phosphate phosphatase domain-containing protein [Methanonatronarchaeia archaeon]UOY09732.1 histidinol phosphate phosphatase domain-containing protein [Methanonatronarchaeum sp. AMET6-2]
MFSDFHIHSTYSDGELLPSEIAERYRVNGYSAIAITDHIDFSNLDVISKLKKLSREIDSPRFVVGAELTFTPPDKIGKLARKARDNGADLIVMHGESPVEPVPEKTNIKAVRSGEVDIIAHPGFIDEETAVKAREKDVFLEVTSRGGHNLTNGHVVKMALEKKTPLIINSDAHRLGDLLTKERTKKVGLGAGLNEKQLKKVTRENPERLLKKIDCF